MNIEKLEKMASSSEKKAAETAVKKAEGVGPLGDVVAGYPANTLLGMVPGYPLVPLSAYIAGLASKPDNSQKSIGPAFLPGVGSYRMGNRIKTQVMRELEQIKKDKSNEGARPVAHAIAEHIGPITSTLAAGALGAAAGAGYNIRAGRDADIGEGASIGGALGLGVGAAAHLVSAIAAAIKRRRSAKEQIESDKESLIAKYLVPGISTYDHYKRIGRSQGERDEAEGSEKSEKRAAFDVDRSKIKGNVNWDAIKQKLTEAKQWYEGQSPETRALIGAGVGLGGGALLGKLMGRTGTGAVAGAVAGAGAGAYWKELKKVIEATKPIASDAAKKTKDRVSQLMQKVRPKSTQGEKAKSPEGDAHEKARDASLGVGSEYAAQFLRDWNRTKAEGLPLDGSPSGAKGVDIVVR